MTEVTLGSSRRPVPLPAHIAHFYSGPDDLGDQLTFARSAIDDPKEALVLFGPRGVAGALLRALEAHVGRDLEAERAQGRIVLAHGDTDPDQQLQTMLGAIREPLSKGFERVRLLASVGWDIPAWPPPEDLLWMESHFTGAIAKLPVAAVCAYDLARMPGDALIYGGIETHPLIYLGGQLSANPQFVEPERYITSRISQLPWLSPTEDPRRI